MTSGTPDTGNGIAAAAAAFEEILSGKSATQVNDRDDAEDPADEAEAPDASETEDETPPDEDGAEDEEETATDDEADEAAEEGERLITVKIDGKVMQIPESEAAKGYQRQADYSRHMQHVVEERKQVQAERQEVQVERAQYAQLLTALQQQLAEFAPQEPDWERLYAEDPLEYVRQKETFRDRQEKLQAVAMENQRLSYLQQQEQAAGLQERVRQGREELFNYNPGWKDKATWDRERVRLREYGVQQGYSEQEISQAYDPRAVRLLHKAMKYDELMSRKPQPVRAEGPRPARGGVSQTVPARKHSDLSKAKMRLAKTGSVRDAAKIFEGLL